MMDYVWAVLLMLASCLGWASNLVGLPGNWFIVGLAACYAYLGPEQGRLNLDSEVVLWLIGLALLAELLEFAAGAVGVKQAGGSKRGAVLALIGSVLGGIVGMLVGVPVPIIGQLVAAVLFAGLGAMAGAVLGERWKGRDLHESWRIGEAAFWGRLWGTLGKTLMGTVMLVLLLAALLV